MTTPTEVEARFAEDGQVTLLSFTWRGRRQPVASHGRHWRADDGLHYLVMTPAEEVFELVFTPLTGLWRVAHTPPRSLTA